METKTSRAMREDLRATLDAALVEPIAITRTGGKENVVMLSQSRYEALVRAELDTDLDFIFDRHAETIEALANR